MSYLCWRLGWISPSDEQQKEMIPPAFCLLGASQERRCSSPGLQIYKEQDREKEGLEKGCQGEDPHTLECGRYEGSL